MIVNESMALSPIEVGTRFQLVRVFITEEMNVAGFWTLTQYCVYGV